MNQPSSNPLVLPVAGMTCAACVYHVGEALRSVDGVTEVSVNLATERATISLDDAAGADAPDLETLARAVADAGYRLDTNPQTDESAGGRGAAPREREEKRLRVRLIVAAVGGGALLLGSFPALPWTPGLLALWWYPLLLWAVSTPIQLWAGWSFYTAGWAGLRRLQPNMHTLIALGTSVAYGYSVAVVIASLLAPGSSGPPGAHQLHFDMAAIIVALILLGRWLEARALSRTSGAIERLLDLRPQTAHLMAADGSISDVPVDHVEAGDALAVRPGEQIPVDGEVTSGSTTVDQSALTGESMPAEKSAGDTVYAGTMNGAGAVLMRATRVGTDTTLAQVIRLVEEAQGSAAPVQRLADRVAAWFVPAVGLIALAAAVLWLFLGPDPAVRYAMLTLVAVFIIACPCALGLATPTAIIVGVGRSAERGILIRSAAALETAHRVDVVAFDKTGTLTTGQLEVADITPAPGISSAEVLRNAASAEMLSEHPMGRAILLRAQAENLAVSASTTFTVHTGAGVTAVEDGQSVAVGNAALMEQVGVSPGADLEASAARFAQRGTTPLFVARDGHVLGVVAVADTVKPGAARRWRLCTARECAR